MACHESNWSIKRKLAHLVLNVLKYKSHDNKKKPLHTRAVDCEIISM